MAAQPVVARVTQGGQISLPAEIRRRWGVDRVLLIDGGDRVEVRPVPGDPVSALLGKYAGGPTAAEMIAAGREEEREIEERRWGRA